MKNNMYLKQYVYRLVHFLPNILAICALQLIGCLVWMNKGTGEEIMLDTRYSMVSFASAVLLFVSMFNVKQDKLCDSIFNNGKVFAVTNILLLLTTSLFVAIVNMMAMPLMKILLTLIGRETSIVYIGYFIPSAKALFMQLSIVFLLVFGIGELVIFISRLLRKFLVLGLVIIGIVLFFLISYGGQTYSPEFWEYVIKHVYLLYLMLIGADIVLFVPSFLIVYFKED